MCILSLVILSAKLTRLLKTELAGNYQPFRVAHEGCLRWVSGEHVSFHIL